MSTVEYSTTIQSYFFSSAWCEGYLHIYLIARPDRAHPATSF